MPAGQAVLHNAYVSVYDVFRVPDVANRFHSSVFGVELNYTVRGIQAFLLNNFVPSENAYAEGYEVSLRQWLPV